MQGDSSAGLVVDHRENYLLSLRAEGGHPHVRRNSEVRRTCLLTSLRNEASRLARFFGAPRLRTTGSSVIASEAKQSHAPSVMLSGAKPLGWRDSSPFAAQNDRLPGLLRALRALAMTTCMSLRAEGGHPHVRRNSEVRRTCLLTSLRNEASRLARFFGLRRSVGTIHELSLRAARPRNDTPSRIPVAEYQAARVTAGAGGAESARDAAAATTRRQGTPPSSPSRRRRG